MLEREDNRLHAEHMLEREDSRLHAKMVTKGRILEGRVHPAPQGRYENILIYTRPK